MTLTPSALNINATCPSFPPSRFLPPTFPLASSYFSLLLPSCFHLPLPLTTPTAEAELTNSRAAMAAMGFFVVTALLF